jgi:hypothetical protein
MNKSSVLPIQCGDVEVRTISETLPCELKDFPCTYHGLLLTLRKPTKSDLLPLIDKVADSLMGKGSTPYSVWGGARHS